MGLGRERAIAMASRDQVIPKPKAKPQPKPKAVTVAASSSSDKPPPPPGAGAVKKQVELYDIAKAPRPQTVTRPLVPQRPFSGVKRKAEDDGGARGRPPQPPAPSTARGTKRSGAPMGRPGRPPQPAGPSLDDLQMPKAKKVDTPPRRVNQKKVTTKVQWSQPRPNAKWSKKAPAR